MPRSRTNIRIILILIIFAVFVSLLLPGKRGILNQIRVRRQQIQLQNEIKILEEKKAQLEEKKEELNQPETIEKIAREKYGMAKEDEKAYTVVDEKEPHAE
ncbi:septum formation initiator family protein [bacterium]|nr:septum formation initiator family protein [bacterium]